MRIVSYFFLYLVMSGMASCVSSSSGVKSSRGYSEDLSGYRIDYEAGTEENTTGEELNLTEPGELTGNITPTHDITGALNDTLEKIAENNKENNVISGYTILVYLGSSRETASEAKDRVYRVLPDSRPQIQYIQPSYKVKVGKFLQRLEAQKTFSMLKEEFPNALIIPEKIEIQ